MKKITSLAAIVAAAFLATAPAGAVPAKRIPVTVTQPDGTELTLTLAGDEYLKYYLTDDGQVVINDSGRFCYATVVDGNLASSGIYAANSASRTATATSMLAGIDHNALSQAMTKRAMATRTARTNISPVATEVPSAHKIPAGRTMLFSNVPAKGEQPGLVVLVEYSDHSFTVSDPAKYYNRFMNEQGFSEDGGTGSARDFFIASSRGQFRPHFDVYGPVKLSKPRNYYGGNDYYGQDKAPEQMVVEAVKALDADVDFSIYDTDKDGFVDNITIIYAGQGEASSGIAETVWPHSWNITYANIKLVADGVQLDRYNCINEWIDNRPDGIGTFCHEFSHVLGLPDLYATNGSHDATPKDWSVMDYGPYNNNGHTPPLHSCYEAYCLGWLTPEIVSGPTYAVLNGSGSGQCYAIETDKKNEFFIFENRTRENLWDSYLPNENMLIWHIDYQKTAWDENTPNNTMSHQRVDLIEADGNSSRNSMVGDSWPGSTRNTEYTLSSRPSFKSWSGYDMKLPLTEIAVDDEGEVSFKIADGVDPLDPTNDLGATPSAESAEISWNAMDGATAYELNVYNEDNGTYDPGMRGIKVTPETSVSRAGKVTYTVEGLDQKTNYSFRVRTVSANSRSPWSDAAQFTTGSEDAIETISTDNAEGPVEYFNLQGVRIDNPAAGTIVICRRGDNTSKIIVR